MALMIKFRIGSLLIKNIKSLPYNRFVPSKYLRSCFHTSWILDVKGKELLMPSLSPTMESGTIIKWLKSEGDKIQPGDAVADIQTDKAVMSMEFDDEAIFAKIIVPEGTKDIKIGTLIALTVEPDEDWKSVEIPSSGGSGTVSAPSPASPVSEPAAVGPSEPPPPGQVNIAMPALSPTMTSGTIVKWLKKEGDEIQPGDALADIQTDKAVMSLEMDEEGVLAKILVAEGSQVTVGQLIAVTVEQGMDWQKAVVPSTTTPSSTTQAPSTSTSQDSQAPTIKKSESSGQVYGLAVKRLLEEYGLNSDLVKGTGRGNRLLKSDILSYIDTNRTQKVTPKLASPPSTKKPTQVNEITSTRVVITGGPSSYEDLPVSNVRGVIAKRLGESKSTIPHSYASIDINVDKLNEIRSKLKSDDIKVSVNDFIAKAVAHALIECPDVNSLYANNQVVRVQNVDVSIAVASPNGLITPIIFDAAAKSLTQISDTIKDLANKAKKGQLKPQEFQGGTFTISNLGMFGIKEFSAIINPPQTAILAVGTGREELDPSLKKVTKMFVTLSYDRRAIDEDQAADFLSILKVMLEDPTFLAVGRAQALRHRRE